MQRGSSRSDHGSRVRRLALTSVIASSTAVLAGQTLAQKVAAVPAASELVASSRQANPIPAWAEFCKRYPTECTVDRSQPATITLTAMTWSTILEVNRRVNKLSIAPGSRPLGRRGSLGPRRGRLGRLRGLPAS